MGFLTEGTTLKWEEAKKYADYIRQHGISQFLNIYRANVDRHGEQLLWGDEIEYMVVKLDKNSRRARISLTGDIAIAKLDAIARENEQDASKIQTSWKPEYGKFMIEGTIGRKMKIDGTPGKPFGENFEDLLLLEANMRFRRELVHSVLEPNEIALSLPNFPMLGTEDSTSPPTLPRGPIANSLYTSDDIIHPHHRFSTLTRNIRIRRGSNVAINVPVFVDEKTIGPTYERERNVEGRTDAKDGHVYLDSMAFGMGMHCLQCTFQTCNLTEARNANDQFAILAPIFLALTAGTPILRGYLTDCDVRWQVISGSVDDRTPSERGIAPLGSDAGVRVINKSRYDSIDSFLSQDLSIYKPEYDDIPLVYDEQIFHRLIGEGIDPQLAKHLSHLFIRDPLVIYSDKIEIDDSTHSDHFENIQSTNWQTVRFKPPPPGTPISWRVEFRPMEIQITDFENAAFATFIVLFMRLMATVGVNLYLPMSVVDVNMKRAHARDSVLTQKFFWRKSIIRTTPKSPGCFKPDMMPSNFPHTAVPNGAVVGENSKPNSIHDEYEEVTMDEIINGKNGNVGLIPLVQSYCNGLKLSPEVRKHIDDSLSLISQRASGKLKTLANWQRTFVTSHPEYKKDSIVTPDIAYDLLTRIHDISSGKVAEPSLLGNFWPHRA